MRIADVIARRLYEAGVRYAFGVPGGEVLTLVDALEAAGIRFLLAKHENAAGFMAEGVWHMTGAPGVLVCTVGPGAANAVNVTANAEQDRVPLIVLTGCVDAGEAVTYNHQIFDHTAVFGPVCKASVTMPESNADALIDKLVRLSMADRPGPVHIDLPIAVAANEVPEARPVRRPAPLPAAPAPGPELEAARAALAKAERPLIVAGLDVVNQDAADTLAAFARKFGAPVIASYKAKGVLPEDDPLSLGGAGLSPLADKHLKPVIEQADFILLAGYDPIEMRPGWQNLWDPEQKMVIELLAAPEYSYMHNASMTFHAHVGESLKALGDGVAPRETWPGNQIAETRSALAGAYGQNEAWGPAAITTTVRANTPRDAVLTIDSGAHRILASQVWEAQVPHAVLQSTGLCTMGCALPLATGAKLAAPERAVVAFTGDGGLEMVLGELVTLRDLKLPVIVVVFVDASLALIEKKQREMAYGNAGVDMHETDFVAIAEALGGHGVVCEDRETLAAAVRTGLEAETFTLCACRIDRQSYDGRI
ncbi:thiamine pyrophosphate-binding protein [Nisaea sp.]|uniref:thiamine pyrophosphate-binding protein n=1 Tax=Nisaea sp. TaxID=2024842 RepID=UPI003B52F169